MRVCRVAPDVTALERVFDYLVPDALATRVQVGTIVRVPLHGRRVRGWVIEDDVAAAAPDSRLLELLAVSSAGPPADVVALTDWIAHRWSGPRAAVLRSASPPNNVPPQPPHTAASVDHLSGGPLTQQGNRVERWGPLADRREKVGSMLAGVGSSIVVVADGGRARALAGYLRGVGRDVALLHSDVTDAQRTDAWARAARGSCVVVGGRIAALAPVPDMAAAIVVDDADEALQEERSPTWHARDVLVERAARANVPFTVLSPAPTVEAIALAGGRVMAPAPDVERTGWPRVLVVDRREEPPGAGLLTESLTRALQAAQGLAVCVLNRRGRFRLLACDTCRELLRWEPKAERPVLCPQCGGMRLRVLRAGVTRIGEELTALLPGARVADVDTDTDTVPDADIVVGTASVLHRPEIRRARPALVAFLDFDQELLAPRYRAAEQAHWLATRGAQLLAGRPRGETHLLVQTRVPEHEVVRALVEARPEILSDAEAGRRRGLGYPPFGALAELTGDADVLDVAAAELVASDLAAAGVRVLGPVAAEKGARALVQAADPAALANALARAVPAARAKGRIRVAVDPPRV